MARRYDYLRRGRVVASHMSGCDNAGTGEAPATGVRTRVVDGSVLVGSGTGATGDRGARTGDTGAGDAGVAVAVHTDQVFRQPGGHAAPPALSGDEFHVAAEPDGHTASRSRAQRGLPWHPVGVRQSHQRAAQHAQAGGQTVRTRTHKNS